MMNFLFTILFLALLYAQCVLAGKVVCSWTGSSRSGRFELIIGYFTVFLLLFFPGFLAQVFHLSSTVYGWMNFVLLAGADAGFILYWRRHRLSLKKPDWKAFFSDYWFILVYVGIFTGFCMASELGFANGGYDDCYYIAKVVNNMGVPRIGVEEYFYGNIISGAGFSLERIFNTYELSYGWLAGLFHIYPAYFCRVTMTIANNVLFCLAMMEFAGLFLRRQDLLQYVMAPIVIFLIPFQVLYVSGYIHSYDSWQLTTAMFYGGSVVRTTMLPVVICAAMPLMKKMSWKPGFLCAGLYLSYLSFSSIAIMDGIVLLLALGLAKLCCEAFTAAKERKWVRLAIFAGGFLLAFAALFAANKVAGTAIAESDALEQMILHKEQWFTTDVLVKYGWIPALGVWILDARREGKTGAWIFLLLWILTCSFRFMQFMLVLAFMYFFVYMRLIASVQMLVCALSAVFLLVIVERFMYKLKWLAAVAAIVMTAGVLGVFQVKSDSWLQYDGLGSGISAAGWNWGRAFDLTTPMVPDAVYEIGEYFDSLPYDNYVTGIPITVPSNGMNVNSKNLLMGTNRIELVSGEAEPVFFEYLQNHNGAYSDIMALASQNNVSYLLSANADTTSELSANGWQPVVLDEGWTLFKSPED